MSLVVEEPWLAPLADLIRRRFGLDFPPARWPDLLRGLRAAAREQGDDDLGAFARRMLADRSDAAPLQGLAEALTVGETYFFREPRSFEVLADDILPPLIDARRSGSRHLRLWSAGCCTGEESYSLAIVLDRLLPAHEEWKVTILATDMNQRFLETAARGEYKDWSFRDAPGWLKEGYFSRGADQRYTIAPRIRRMVKFMPLNLAELRFPQVANDTCAMDVIFCRNVLMYFSARQLQRVSERLGAALVDGGWLSVSATELGTRVFQPLSAVHFGDAVFYRKAAAGAQPQQAPPAGADVGGARSVAMPQPVAPFAPVTRMPKPAAAPRQAHAPGPVLPDAAADEAAGLARLAREHADAGRLLLAREAVEQALGAARLDAGLHQLHAVILEELGRTEDARTALRRALYLEPDLVLAHYTLGRLASREERHADAERHFRNVLALLARIDADEVLPHSGGLAAGRLRSLVEQMLEPQKRR